jgi:1-phosphatidylinositol phosphodiesterase
LVNGGWYADSRIPNLGEVRGKIVLLRRFALHDDDDQSSSHDQSEAQIGLNAENWIYNSPSCQYGHVCVQDFCEVLEPKSIERKIEFCCAHFERASATIGAAASAGGVAPLFLNFLSGSNLWNVGCWPERIAAKINPAVTAFLCERHATLTGDGSIGQSQEAGEDLVRHVGAVGVVVCDWVGKDDDWSIIRLIIAMNGWLSRPTTAS